MLQYAVLTETAYYDLIVHISHFMDLELFCSTKLYKFFCSTKQYRTVLYNLFKDCIDLFMRHIYRERQRHRQREKQAPRREPNVGLDPRTPGSRPEPKEDAQPLSHPGTVLQLF